MKIQLPQLNKILDVEKGQNLFKVLKDNDIAIASSCGGEGICGKCIVKITQGQVQEASQQEIELKRRMDIDSGYRLSCQIPVKCDLILSTTYW